MENQPAQKQWWAPIWKGLVMDTEAKHYRTMKNAVWLYLYLLLNANRRTGVLMRKIQTMSNDMGVTRHTALRWLAILRNADYIKTVNTGRSLTIQIMRWNPIAGVGKTQLQKSAISDFRYEQYPTSRQTHVRPIPPQIGAISGFAAATNETKIQINVINDPRGGISQKPMNNGLTSIGDSIRRELLAQELAKGLNDQAGISLYRSYSVNYPEWLLRKVLAEVRALPPERISKSRGALFNYLVQYHAKGVTKNPRD